MASADLACLYVYAGLVSLLHLAGVYEYVCMQFALWLVVGATLLLALPSLSERRMLTVRCL